MPWTRHILQSVMIPVVTHSRISGDYQPGNSQWIVGDSTILEHAVGLAAFKDVSMYYHFTGHVREYIIHAYLLNTPENLVILSVKILQKKKQQEKNNNNQTRITF